MRMNLKKQLGERVKVLRGRERLRKVVNGEVDAILKKRRVFRE